MKLTERFLRYVSCPTASCEANEACPSSEGQLALAKLLVMELQEMGAKDAHMDENGYVYAVIPANTEEKKPVIGFIAHMDTSPDCSGENIKAAVKLYEGGDLLLNEEESIFLSPKDFPSLERNIGKHLIVTDGTTLLGADDKAGIAEIMEMADTLLHSDRPHGEIRVAFTPDEEIGRGADLFDVQKFGCDFAYTADGGTLGELEYENFNAASAAVTVYGTNIHPGSAKDKMKNAMTMAMEFNALLPADQVPEKTEGYEGFFHLVGMEGCVETATLHYIIRDHDMEKFEEKKRVFHEAGKTLCQKYGEGTFITVSTDSYYNMKKQILPHMEIIRLAEKAMEEAGVTPVTVPIRGGTDGARLSFMGLPCPNLCTGGENYHGRFEYIPVEDMERCAEILLNIACGA
ncbi:MAG: peptidase T [Oscillospiraceae bacterium]|nr:peptidase T [Oscillospiraceae bacterium]